MTTHFVDQSADRKHLAGDQSAEQVILSALCECEEYFDNRADADCDQDGFIPNKELQLLTVVQAAIALIEGRRS